jgi:2'-5' RNA ligase
MADTALVVMVPEAEPYVSALRERYDPAAAVGVPAHITVLFPFVPFEQLSSDVLHRIDLISASTRPFDFHLSSVARFSDCFYLKPEPAQPFIDITSRVVAEFPAYPPYRGLFDSIIPHLTVARGGEDDLIKAARLLNTAHPILGFECRCESLVLIENSSGRWTQNALFELASRRGSH